MRERVLVVAAAALWATACQTAPPAPQPQPALQAPKEVAARVYFDKAAAWLPADVIAVSVLDTRRFKRAISVVEWRSSDAELRALDILTHLDTHRASTRIHNPAELMTTRRDHRDRRDRGICHLDIRRQRNIRNIKRTEVPLRELLHQRCRIEVKPRKDLVVRVAIRDRTNSIPHQPRFT